MSDNDSDDKTEEIKERLKDDDTLGGTSDGDSNTVLTLDSDTDEDEDSEGDGE